VGDWKKLLTDWGESGALARAVREALMLEGEPEPLKRLENQWRDGDFSGLPPIVLLPGSLMPGAAGAYAISTGTIYLNQDWLAGASAAQAIAVLTEELGHHLDGLLNAVDTPGDEGELFARMLTEKGLSDSLAALRRQNDNNIVTNKGARISVENASISSYANFTEGNLGPSTDMPWGDESSIRLANGTIIFASNKNIAVVPAPYGGGDALGQGLISFINPLTGLKARDDISIGSGKTIVNGITETPDGGFLVYGGAKESLHGSSFGGALDSFVIKYDASGDFKWIQSFNTTLHEYVAGASVDASGNIYLSGRTSFDLSEPRSFSYSINWYDQSLGFRYYAAFSAQLSDQGQLNSANVYGGLSGGMAVAADSNGYLTTIYTGVIVHPRIILILTKATTLFGLKMPQLMTPPLQRKFSMVQA